MPALARTGETVAVIPEQRAAWRPGRPVDVHATLGTLRRGAGDPAYAVDAAGAIWRAVRTPEGPATLCVVACGDEIRFTAWGAGAEWLVGQGPAMLGEGDDPSGFAPRHPLLRELARRFDAWRMPRSGIVLDALVPAVLEQKVTGTEARRSWRALLRAYGEPAPGPAPDGMRVPPPAALWRRVPSWDWHRAGVDGKRARTVLEACARAGRLEQTLGLPHPEAERRLRAVPGIGIWTAAEVRQRAHGDADAESVGDIHLCKDGGWALAGRPVDDDGMLELLAPYAGHRYRVVRLLQLSGFRRPRFAPRYAPTDYRAI